MDFSLSHLWASMGLFARMIAIILLFMSGASLLVMFERIIVFAKSRSESYKFAEKMAKLLAGGDITAAANAGISKGVGHIGRVINAGLVAFKLAPSDRDTAIESVARALERQAAREVQVFKRGLGVLATVGSTAPFIGLLGTVWGVMEAFAAVATQQTAGIQQLAPGVSGAMLATIAGLVVAIPSVFGYNLLLGNTRAMITELENYASSLADRIELESK